MLRSSAVHAAGRSASRRRAAIAGLVAALALGLGACDTGPGGTTDPDVVDGGGGGGGGAPGSGGDGAGTGGGPGQDTGDGITDGG